MAEIANCENCSFLVQMHCYRMWYLSLSSINYFLLVTTCILLCWSDIFICSFKHLFHALKGSKMNRGEGGRGCEWYQLIGFWFLYISADYRKKTILEGHRPFKQHKTFFRGQYRNPVPFWPLQPGSGTGFLRIPELGSRILNPYFLEISDNFLGKVL